MRHLLVQFKTLPIVVFQRFPPNQTSGISSFLLHIKSFHDVISSQGFPFYMVVILFNVDTVDFVDGVDIVQQ